MTIITKTVAPTIACAALIGLAGPVAAKTVTQTGAPFKASGSIDTGNFNEEDDTRLVFDRFDPTLGTLTRVTLDYDLTSAVSGTFDVAGQGGGWNANTVVVLDWDAGGFREEDGDGDGSGGPGGSDAFDIAASVSGSADAQDLSAFTGDGRTDVFLKYVVDANGGPGAFDANYDVGSSVSLIYFYDEASGDDDGDGMGGSGGGDQGGMPPSTGGGGMPTDPTLPAPIPLPAGLPLLLAGLGALGLARRLRRG